MNNAQFDRLFDAAFEGADMPEKEGPSVDHRASWQRVRQRLNAQRRKKSIRSMLAKLAVVSASLALGAFLFGSDRAVKAIEPIYTTIKEYPSGLLNLIFGRDEHSAPYGAKTSPPPAHLEGLSFERVNDSTLMATVTEAQANSLLSFRPPAFEYLPEGVAFHNAVLYFQDGEEKANYAVFRLRSEQDDILSVVMQKVDARSSFGTRNTQDGISSQTLQLSDGPAILLTENDASSTLETITNGIRFSISGKFDVETLVRIYEGMRG
ncbi:DUF4367 domain-containing protein [Cohnella hongkongensis]|uniref:DUF4367 domain-containing protein n=1 Tax=Cohnella hongkongensis TaxID=178337 RepID=A0ABV9F9K0_9BACL